MKHITGLAHIALFTKDLEASVKFYECLGGKVTGQADVQKPLGTNHIKIVSMPGFDLEIIEPHDGTDVTAQGGLFPHIAIEVNDFVCDGRDDVIVIAIEVNDIVAAIADLKAAGITNFRGGVDKAADLPIFGGIRNAFFIGPNGEQLELLQHL